MFSRKSTTKKRKSRLSASVVIAVLALAAVGATSASAHTPLELSNSWYVGSPPTRLSGTKTVQTQSVGTTLIEGSLAEKGAFPVKIRSTGVECVGCVIENSGSEAQLKGALKFTGVTMEGGGCTTTPTIQLNPVVGTAYTTAQSFIEFHPASGTTLATINVSGSGCVLAGLYSLTGEFTGQFVNARGVFQTQQEVTFPKALNGGLRLAGQPASLSAAMKTSLSPERSFGLKDGSTKELLHGQFTTPSTNPTLPRNWYTGAQPGTKLAGAQGVQMSLASEKLFFEASVAGIPVELTASSLECANCKIENRIGTGENKSNTEAAFSGEIVLGGLNVVSPANCSTSSSLRTNPMTGVVGGEKGSPTTAAFRLSPTSGIRWVLVQITGEKCPISGKYFLSGDEFGVFANPLGVAAKTQLFGLGQGIQETLGIAGSLKFGENPVFVNGEVNVTSAVEIQVKEK